SLWVRYASLLVVQGQTTGVEEKLQAAETALQDSEMDNTARDLIGQIAAIRGTLAFTRYQLEPALSQAQRALEYLSPNNLFSLFPAHWVQGAAYLYQGKRARARDAIIQANAFSKASGNTFTTILATMGLGQIQEIDNELFLAVQTYRHALQLAGDQPLRIV